MKRRSLLFLTPEKSASKRSDKKKTPSKLKNIPLTVTETANKTDIGTQTELSSSSSSKWNCQV